MLSVHLYQDIELIKHVILKLLESKPLKIGEIIKYLYEFKRRSEIDLDFDLIGNNEIENIIKILRFNNFITNNSPTFTLTASGKEKINKIIFHPQFSNILNEMLKL